VGDPAFTIDGTVMIVLNSHSLTNSRMRDGSTLTATAFDAYLTVDDGFLSSYNLIDLRLCIRTETAVDYMRRHMPNPDRGREGLRRLSQALGRRRPRMQLRFGCLQGRLKGA
jgi:hypothetical protein